MYKFNPFTINLDKVEGGGAGGGVFEEVAAVVRQASPDYDEDFVFGSPQLDDDGDVLHDGRFFFDKSKRAFRTGGVETNRWDEANIGDYSFAGGFNNEALGRCSAVLTGENNNANELDSAVLSGDNNITNGQYSAIFTGMYNETVGFLSMVGAGALNLTNGNYSAILGGNRNTTQGTFSAILGGEWNGAGGDYSFAGTKYMRLSTAAHRTFVWGYNNWWTNLTTPDAFLIFPSGTLGNMGLGTQNFGASARAVFSIGNGTPPSSSIANGIQLYAEDVGGSSEFKVRDEAGNITVLSPHHFSLFEKPNPLAWSYYSKQPYSGKEINVDMWSAIKAIEELSGKKFIYTADVETENKEEQKREAVIQEKMREDIEIPFEEAIEEIFIKEMVNVGKEIIYELNIKTGELVEKEKTKYEERITKKRKYQIKKNSRIDEITGKCYRLKIREEANLLK